MKIMIVLIATVLFASSCYKKEENNNKKSNAINATLSEIMEIIGTGKVEPESDIINLAAPSGGIINRVFKKEGDTINAGSNLIQIDDALDLIAIKRIESQLQTQKSQILIEQAAYNEVEAKLTNKKKVLAATINLLNKDAETRQTLDDVTTDVKTLEASLEKATAIIKLAQNRLTELNYSLQTAKTEANKKNIISPYGGTILRMTKAKGEALSAYETYAEIAPKGNIIVNAEIDELFSNKLRLGLQVVIRLVGNEKAVANGVVSMVSPYLRKKSIFSERTNDQEDRRVRAIKITLNDSPDLIINSKVECIVKLK